MKWHCRLWVASVCVLVARWQLFPMGFSGHIRVTVLTGAVTGVASIQTSGVICVGRAVVVVIHKCKEHLDAMPALLLVYRAVMHVSGLASG